MYYLHVLNFITFHLFRFTAFMIFPFERPWLYSISSRENHHSHKSVGSILEILLSFSQFFPLFTNLNQIVFVFCVFELKFYYSYVVTVKMFFEYIYVFFKLSNNNINIRYHKRLRDLFFSHFLEKMSVWSEKWTWKVEFDWHSWLTYLITFLIILNLLKTCITMIVMYIWLFG